jgi:hypothetical protein
MLSTEQLQTLMAIARRVHAAGVAPKEYTEDTVFAVMLAGVELGIEPMQSLTAFHVIKGRITMRADFVVALCVRSPVCRFFRIVESTDKVATYEALRDGHAEPTRLSYRLEQAQRAGLMSNAQWKNHPEAMLRARCSAALARAMFPDLAAGIYTPDEGEEIAANDNPRALREPAPPPRELPASTTQEHPALAAYRARLVACTTSAELIAVRLALGPTLRPLSEAEQSTAREITRERGVALFGNAEDFDGALVDARALSQEAAHWSTVAAALAAMQGADSRAALESAAKAHATALAALPPAVKSRVEGFYKARRGALTPQAPTDVAAGLEAELLAAGDIAALDDVAAKIETAVAARALTEAQAKALIDRYNNRVAEYEREPVQDAAE